MKRINALITSSFVFCICSLITFLIGYSTSNWLVSDQRRSGRSGFVQMGLWRACFREWSYYRDYIGRGYDGCRWIFSYEYQPFWKWINPPWLLSVQVIMTLNLLLQITTVVLLWLFTAKRQKDFRASLALGGMSTLAGFFTAICVGQFGTYSVVDLQWVENPSKTYLSYSFGVVVVSGFFSLYGGMCALCAGIDTWRAKNKLEREEQQINRLLDREKFVEY